MPEKKRTGGEAMNETPIAPSSRRMVLGVLGILAASILLILLLRYAFL
ncbi:MAG TPA: hypothetical protein VL221_07540 [Bacteroidota bacterium]|nr:hypothetical protein [Bacteroidota bacterium]